jgi:glycosyltransferase involved in cell wall biosynthesis
VIQTSPPIKVLAVGQTPPPYHGQSMMIQMLVDGPVEGVELHHVRMAFSDNMNEVGRFQFRKLFHLIFLILRIYWGRIRHGAKILYYPPAGPNRVPLIRDALLLLCTRWLFRKTIFHFHAAGASELLPTLPWWFQAPVKRALHAPDAAIQLSPLTIPDADFFKAKRVFIVPNGVDDLVLDRLTLPAKRYLNSVVNLLYLGTVCESKGVLLLLESCCRLSEFGVDYHLHVVGSFQPSTFERVVREKIQELKLEAKVTLHGQRTGDEKSSLFASSDIFCFPTHYEAEGFPCVIVEAMSFSLPVISTRWRGIPSIVVDGETGCLIETKDSEALASKIGLLAGDKSLREKMGQEGRVRFESKFTRSKHLKMMSDVFLAVAKEKP